MRRSPPRASPRRSATVQTVASVSTQYDEIWEHVYGDMQTAGPVHRHMRRMLRPILARLSYESVLDVGCGRGDNYRVLARDHTLKRYTGIDASARALELAGQSVVGDFHQLDIQSERLDGTWDIVFSSLVLEHIPDDEAALRNMRAMTARHLVITTIAGDFERYRGWDERIGHVRNYARGELESKLERAGFRVEETIYWGFPFYTPIARELQNRSAAGTAKFGAAARAAARTLYWLYFLNSRRRGDLLIAAATAE